MTHDDAVHQHTERLGDIARRITRNINVHPGQPAHLPCGLANCPCPHNPDGAPSCDAGWGPMADGRVTRCRICRAHARTLRYQNQRPGEFADAHIRHVAPAFQQPIFDWYSGPRRTLVLSGPVGVGKSYAAYALTNQAVHDGVDVAAWTVADFVADAAPEGDPGAMATARTVSLLLLDDLGAEKASEWRVEQIVMLLDARIRNGLRQIVTTNAGYSDLAVRYGDRVMSRLTGGAAIVKFTGPDRRRNVW
jgi:DNA replication protein DnaC